LVCALRRAGELLAAVDEPEVPGVDKEAGELADDDDQVLAMEPVGEEDEAAGQAEEPEGRRDYAGPFALGGDPLDEKAGEEEGLSEEADGGPDVPDELVLQTSISSERPRSTRRVCSQRTP